MTDETYNGWTNRETWLVHLWLSNEPATYETARELARTSQSDLAAGTAIHVWLMGDDAPWPIPTTGLLTDLIGQALYRVDWRAIGRAFREE
jgi:hypothetical protein